MEITPLYSSCKGDFNLQKSLARLGGALGNDSVSSSFSQCPPHARHTGSAHLSRLGWMCEVLRALKETSIPLVRPILCPLRLEHLLPASVNCVSHCTLRSGLFWLHRRSCDQAHPIRAPPPRYFLAEAGGEPSLLFSHEARRWIELPVATAAGFLTGQDEVRCTKRQTELKSRCPDPLVWPSSDWLM